MSKVAGSKGQRKAKYFQKLEVHLKNFDKILLIKVDNVGSKQLQQIRGALRGKAIVLMGKNTIIKRAIRTLVGEYPQLEVLQNYMVGNIGFVFVEDDLIEARDIILDNRLPAAAKSGLIAPCDVVVPKGNTGLDPNQTSFMQALNISTKISRGQIEILRDVPLIKEGDVVEPSQATLLSKLNIKPFAFGAEVIHVYEKGSMYAPDILDIKEEDILAKFSQSVKGIASVSMSLNYPTVLAVPHLLLNSFKNIVAVSLEADYEFPQMIPYKEFLADPSKFLAAETKEEEEKPAEEAEAEPEPESESESEEDDLDDLFG